MDTVITKLRKLNIELGLVEGKLKINAPEGVVTAEIMDEIKANKHHLIEYLVGDFSKGNGHTLPKAPPKQHYQLSSAQKRIHFLYELDKSSIAYNETMSIGLRGKLDKGKLNQAFQELIDRHEILRTSFQVKDEGPVQVVAPSFDFRIESHQCEQEQVEFVIRKFVRPFDLGSAPLLRVCVIELPNNEHILVVDMHHIVTDGTSYGILIREFTELYSGKELSPVQFQYKDFVEWQQSLGQLSRVRSQKEFWLDQFREPATIIDLPYDFPRPVNKTYGGKQIEFSIGESDTRALKSIAQRDGSTLFMVILGIYSILLSKLSNRQDIIVGTPTAGRQHSSLNNIIGLFLNTIPLRNHVDRSLSFREYLASITRNTVACFDHQSFPYEQLIDELKLDRDPSRNPLFDVMFIFQNYEDSQLAMPGVTLHQHRRDRAMSKLDLTLNAFENKSGLVFEFDYSSELFKDETIDRLIGYFRSIVSTVVANTNIKISAIDILPATERQLILDRFNDTAGLYPDRDTIVSLFERQAKKTPDQIAVVYEGRHLSYRELSNRSNQLALYLQSRFHVVPDTIIGVMVERSELLQIGLLGVLKAQGAYVPLDSSYPQDRISFILNDSGANVLLISKPLREGFQFNGHIVNIAEDECFNGDTAGPGNFPEPKDLCYLIYTSGSTGRPKGVMISHGNVVNFFAAMDNGLPLQETDTLLAITSTSFDISVLELLWTLCRGVQVVVHPSEIALNGLDRYVADKDLSMEFSLFFFSSYNNKAVDKYNLLMESVKYADQAGFTAVWTPERHFHEFGGLYPNPSVISAALAVVTDRIQLRSGSVVSPLHDAIRIAEEWSVVDNLSRGRVGLSFASGWNTNDFVLGNSSYKDRHKTMYDQIAEVKKLWKGGFIERTNGIGQKVEVKIFPLPVQGELPVWITAANSEETFRSAGAMGANLLTHLLGQDIEQLTGKINVYRKAREEAGFNPTDGIVTIMLHAYIGDDIDEVEKTVEQPFIEYLKSSIGLSKALFEEAGIKEDELSEVTKKSILKNAFKRYYKTSSLIGTKTICSETIQRLKLAGVDEIACLIDFGVEEDKVLAGLKNLNDLRELYSKKRERKYRPVTAMQSTPSLIRLLSEDPGSQQFIKSLKFLLIGGEPLPVSLLRKLKRDTKASLFNMYGPTETTIWSCMHGFGDDVEKVVVGEPILNNQVYVLDQDLQLVPIGCIGRLYIGGNGLSRGYWNREELTKQKFVANPFESGERIYDTGDVARWLADGTIELLGREDQQIKLHGYRIELGEIETTLRNFSEVREAVATIQEKSEGDKILVAYVVADNPLDMSKLREFLADRLPYYMVPVHFMQLPQVPLTPNGKVDRKALPDPQISVTGSYVEPRTREEKLLHEIWSKVLGVTRVGIEDNFFSSGGDSIKSIQIISRMRSAGYELAVKDIFTALTIKGIALKLRPITSISDQSTIIGTAQLTPIQHWFFDNSGVRKHHYNQSVLLNFKDYITRQTVQAIFSKLQEHHDALRITFIDDDGRKLQKNNDKDLPLSLIEYDLRDGKDAASALNNAANQLQSGIDLERGPLMRLGLFHMSDGSRLLIVIHHLVVDGVSWRILFEDIESLWQQVNQHKSLTLPPKTDAFLTWADHLSNYTKHRSFINAGEYWDALLSRPTARIPRDNPDGENVLSFSINERFRLSKDDTSRLLREAHRPFTTKINDLLLAALLLSLKRKYDNRSVLVDVEAHGREEINSGVNISRTIGWFTAIYPVLLESESDAPKDVIKNVKESLARVPNKGIDYLLKKYYQADSRDPSLSGAQITFNYLGQFDSDTKGKAFEIARESKGEDVPLDSLWDYDWDILGSVSDEQLEIRLLYNSKQYNTGTIKSFLDSYQQSLVEIIDYCCNYPVTELTPSDLTFEELPLAKLAEYQDKYDVEDIYPLSPLQGGILFHSLLNSDSEHYFQQISCYIKGDLDVSAIEKSMEELMKRYSVLRTTFSYEGYDRPLQIVLKSREMNYTYTDIRSDILSGSTKDIVKIHQAKAKSEKFDLQKVLIRVSLLQTGDDEFVVIWNYHHLLMDGWCMSIIIDDFREIYSQICRGKSASLPPVTPYSEYIDWLERRRERDDLRNYWREHLAGYDNVVSLPVKENRPLDNRYEQAVVEESIDSAVTNELIKIAGSNDVTVNALLQASWALLLSRYNNTDDVVFGLVVSGRPSEINGIESMVGLFINTIPVRVKIGDAIKVSDLLTEVQNDAIASEPYHFEALSEIQSLSSLGGNLFNHILVFENFPMADQIVHAKTDRINDFEITGVEVFEQTNYDLTIVIVPGNEVHIRFHYNEHVYDRRIIENVIRHWQMILRQIASNNNPLLSTVELLTPGEKQTFLQEFNATTTNPFANENVVNHFVQQAFDHPDRTAVRFDSQEMSYSELNNACSNIASYLQSMYGIGKGDLVGIMLGHEHQLLSSIYGVLKTGAAYVPIDPNYPIERINSIVKDSGLKALITRGTIKNVPLRDVPIVDLDRVQNAIDNPSSAPTRVEIHDDDLAYVIYTSGSTGTPKGVMISHRSLMNYIRWAARTYVGDSDSTFALYSSIAFDLTVTSIFTPLISGNKIIIYSDDDVTKLFTGMFSDNVADIIKLTPSHLKVIELLSNVTIKKALKFIVGGEELETTLTRAIFNKFSGAVKIFNEYGPTEATVGCMIYRFDPHDTDATVPIGVPISNTQIYLLDRSMRPVPYGANGEIYIGGTSVATGYLSQETLTAGKFVDNPFDGAGRLYRTGDLGCRLLNDVLTYRGRIDDQVKIRGFRIELGEIQDALSSHELVRESIVTVNDNGDNRHLVGYYVSEDQVTGLREFLSDRLPFYMVPSCFVRIDKIPLTQNGKLAKDMLPKPDHSFDQNIDEAPLSQNQGLMAGIWKDVLKIERRRIGRKSNFFELGGHSIKVIQLIDKIHRQFKVRIGLKKVFDHAVLDDLTEFVEQQELQVTTGIPRAAASGFYPASSAQKRLFYEQVLDPNSTTSNVPSVFRLVGDCNLEEIEATFQLLVDRHESLRTQFFLKDEAVVQVIEPSVKVTVVPIVGKYSSVDEGFQDFVRPFELSSAPLMRLGFLELHNLGKFLFVDIHHIVCDGISTNMLMNEFKQAYNGEILPPVTLRYVDYACWQKTMTGDTLKHKEYWTQQLSGQLPTINLPTTQSREAVNIHAGARKTTRIDGDTYAKVKSSARRFNCSEMMFLLSVYYVLIARISGNNEIIVGTDAIGRTHPDLRNIVGTFVNVLPLRISMDTETSFEQLLLRVKQCVLGGFEHQEFQFDDMYSLLENKEVTRIVDLYFSHTNFFESEAEAKGISFAPLELAKIAGSTRYELEVNSRESYGELDLTFIYCTDLYEEDTIGLFMKYFGNILTVVVDSPEMNVNDISLEDAF